MLSVLHPFIVLIHQLIIVRVSKRVITVRRGSRTEYLHINYIEDHIVRWVDHCSPGEEVLTLLHI